MENKANEKVCSIVMKGLYKTSRKEIFQPFFCLCYKEGSFKYDTNKYEIVMKGVGYDTGLLFNLEIDCSQAFL